MRFQKAHIVLGNIVILIAMNSCVEPFEANTKTFSGVLVIDAKLTNEEKQHEVLLSRARTFEADSIVPETNAIVKIVDDLGMEFSFEEKDAGRYVSNTVFGSKPNNSYQLSVTTVDGNVYYSESVSAPINSEIGRLYVERDIQENEEGVGVLVDNSENNDGSKYYRYEYEETYKIVAPYYSPFELKVEIFTDLEEIDVNIDNGLVYYPSNEDGGVEFFFITVEPREKDVSTCYTTRKSTNIVLASSDIGAADVSSRFLVRFVKRQDYAISYRYSVLVKQFVLSRDAHAYYSNLSDFSSSESVFTQVKPGFLEGNITSLKSSNQKVIGYFEVASVSEKRLFFNYSDFFSGEPLSLYSINCEPTGNPALSLNSGHSTIDENREEFIVDGISTDSPLIQGILENTFVYYAHNEDYQDQLEAQVEATMNRDGLSPYYVKSTACGDCTVLGSLEKPDFWIE